MARHFLSASRIWPGWIPMCCKAFHHWLTCSISFRHPLVLSLPVSSALYWVTRYVTSKSENQLAVAAIKNISENISNVMAVLPSRGFSAAPVERLR